MRKKMLAAAAVMLMAVVMATSAFAATPSVVLTPPTQQQVIMDNAGLTVVPGAYKGDVVVDGVTGADVIKATGVKLPSGINAANLTVISAFDLECTAGTIPASGVSVTIPVPGAAVGNTYVMLHKAASGWEVVGSGTVAAGSRVTGVFKSFSPVIVLTAPANGGAPVLAPQTGVNSAETLAATVVVAGVAVAIFAAKKIKE